MPENFDHSRGKWNKQNSQCHNIDVRGRVLYRGTPQHRSVEKSIDDQRIQIEHENNQKQKNGEQPANGTGIWIEQQTGEDEIKHGIREDHGDTGQHRDHQRVVLNLRIVLTVIQIEELKSE